jgi:hypothetical protein
VNHSAEPLEGLFLSVCDCSDEAPSVGRRVETWCSILHPRLHSMTQPTSWQQLWEQAQPTLNNAERSLTSTTSPIASRILRVGQLDAELLDVELVNLLRDPLSKALGLVNVRPPSATNWCPLAAPQNCF